MSDGGVLEVVFEGHQLTQQLDSYLNECCSVEYCRPMVQSILAAWEKLMFMANTIPHPSTAFSTPLAKLESPEVWDSMVYQQPFGGEEQHKQNTPKKRKTALPTWTSQFRACSPSGGADDGFSWRKYGQKEILGFKQPRCYYRCSHRFTQNCWATKQIQRSEQDLSVYDVKYQGTHTCVKKSKEKSSPGTADTIPVNPHFDIEIFQSFKTGLRVQTEGLPGSDQEAPSTSASAYLTPSFSTPSPLAEDGFAFSGSFSDLSSFMSTAGVAADEPGNSFWADTFLGGHESIGAEMAMCSAVPFATISPAGAAVGVESVSDALFELDSNFPDFFTSSFDCPTMPNGLNNDWVKLPTFSSGL